MVDQIDAIEALLGKRDFKRAEVLIARSLRASLNAEERVQLLIARARVRLKSGRIDDALIDLQKVQQLIPQEIEQPHVLELVADCHLARFELASVGFTDRGDTSKAREVYERLLQTHPAYANSGWVHYQMGRIFLTEFKTQEAVGCFHAALLEPSTAPALTSYCYERLGFIDFYEMRRLEPSLNFLNKAVATYPVFEDPYWLVQVHILRSRVLRELKRVEESVEAARMAVNLAASSESKRGLSDALLSVSETLSPLQGKERETIQYLQQFVQISKKPLGIDVTWARVYEMLGDAYAHSNQHINALAAYEAAFQYNPYTPWELSLHYRLARSAYQAGEYERALQAIDRMIKVSEADGESVTDHRVFALLGNTHYALNHYDEAVKAYEHAITCAPNDAPDLETIHQYRQLAVRFIRRV